MSSRQVEGKTIDVAAQIVADSYEVIPSLLAEVGLEESLIELPSGLAVERDGKLRTVSLTAPHSLVTGGLIRLTELPVFSALTAIPELFHSMQVQSARDVTEWAAFDDSSAEAWSRDKFGDSLTDRLLEPFLAALYFKELDQVSKATFLSVGASAFPSKKPFVIRGGIGSLCHKLGERVAHSLDCRVTGIARRPDGSYGVSTSQGEFESDAVILAVPAPAARGLLPETTPEERAILSTEYMPSMTVAISTRADWTRDSVPDSWFSLYPARESRDLVYMAFSSTLNVHAQPSDEGLLKFILSGPRIREIWNASPESILERLATETAGYLPGLRDAGRVVATLRFEHGMPDPGEGRFRKIRDYRAGAESRASKVLLAGDYTSHITTDGAAESGAWAAHQLLGHST